MKDQQELLEKFDFILENSTMDPNALKAENDINTNEVMHTEFEDHKLLVDGIRYASRKKLLDSMQTWDSDIATQSEFGQIFMKQRWYFAAASIVIVFMFAFILTYFLKSDNDLVASYYRPYTFESEVTRGETTVENNEFFRAYRRGEYKKAMELYNSGALLGDEEMTDFLYANACQVQGMYDEAIPVFEAISKKESPLAPAASWYLAICYISKGSEIQAALILKDLSKIKSSYSVKAQALLADLEKNPSKR